MLRSDDKIRESEQGREDDLRRLLQRFPDRSNGIAPARPQPAPSTAKGFACRRERVAAPQKFLNERPAYVAGAAYNQFYRWQVTLSLSVHWMA
jgi:hypothetical protein